MVKVSEAFPSKYLTAADLENHQVRAIIGDVVMEDIAQGQRPKPVAYFSKSTFKKPEIRRKGLVLNKTNCSTLAKKYGDEMNAWSGKELVMFAMQVDFKGELKDAIRVRVPQPQPAPAPVQSSSEDGFDDFDDDDSGVEIEDTLS